MASPPYTFFRDELHRALSEQSYGISSFTLKDQTSRLFSAASVELLEGNVIEICLTAHGYGVMSICVGITLKLTSVQIVGSEGTHETVDALLSQVSPRYREAQNQALFSKLQAL